MRAPELTRARGPMGNVGCDAHPNRNIHESRDEPGAEMAEITAATVMARLEETGLGMMDCKKALL